MRRGDSNGSVPANGDAFGSSKLHRHVSPRFASTSSFVGGAFHAGVERAHPTNHAATAATTTNDARMHEA
jgi:hypothetical protein